MIKAPTSPTSERSFNEHSHLSPRGASSSTPASLFASRDSEPLASPDLKGRAKVIEPKKDEGSNFISVAFLVAAFVLATLGGVLFTVSLPAALTALSLAAVLGFCALNLNDYEGQNDHGMREHINANFVTHSNAGGGNCLFHSLSHFTPGYSHSDIRREIANYISNNREDFEDFLVNEKTDKDGKAIVNRTKGDINGYIKFISKIGTWGGDLEIKAFEQWREIIGMPVKVFVYDSRQFPTIREVPEGPVPENYQVIHIKRHRNHWEALTPKASA